MRSYAVILAATLATAPLGARAPTSSCGGRRGSTPQEDEAIKEIVAAFEQETGKQVELAFYPQQELAATDRGGAGGGPPARLRVRHTAS